MHGVCQKKKKKKQCPGIVSFPEGLGGGPLLGLSPCQCWLPALLLVTARGGAGCRRRCPPGCLMESPGAGCPSPAFWDPPPAPFLGARSRGGDAKGPPPLRRGRGSLLASPRCGFGDVVTRPAVAQRAHAGTGSPLSPLPKVWDPRLWGAPRSRARGQKGRPGESGGSLEAAGSETSL